MKKIIFASIFSLATLMGAGACAVTDDQSTVGEYVDDTTITTRVKARLVKDDQVSARRINVETLKGVVVLSGFAVSEKEKDRAAEVARNVPNVKAVRNSIVVEPPESK